MRNREALGKAVHAEHVRIVARENDDRGTWLRPLPLAWPDLSPEEREGYCRQGLAAANEEREAIAAWLREPPPRDAALSNEEHVRGRLACELEGNLPKAVGGWKAGMAQYLGLKVRTAQTLTGGDYVEAARARRKPGVIGRVIGHSDSHGFCYHVEHEDKTCGWYDPGELALVDPR